MESFFWSNTRVTIYGGMTDKVQNFIGTVFFNPQIKNFWMLFQKRGVTFPFKEDRVSDHLLKETNIGFDTANTKFLQRTVHGPGCVLKA